MATTFLEPGGDATFNVANTTSGGFWQTITGSPAIATDFVNTGHIKSIKYPTGGANEIITPNGILSDAGSRMSAYLYFNAFPSVSVIFWALSNAGGGTVLQIRLTNAGVLQLFNGTGSQLGSNGSITLTTGIWYRISLAYTIGSTTVNRFELFVDGSSCISLTNVTLSAIGSSRFRIGNVQANANLDMRSSDHYTDNSSSLTDTGNIWVTAKRPNANGTAHQFNTQIGSGGSGYGTGDSPQINERPLSTTNGWSQVGAGGAATEEFNIESKSVGDINISTATIVDYVGWVYASSALSETGTLVLSGTTNSISITSTNTMFTKVAGSTTYPPGTGTDIGLTTDTTVTTVSLYECGVMVAYIPASTVTKNNLSLLNAG